MKNLFLVLLILSLGTSFSCQEKTASTTSSSTDNAASGLEIGDTAPDFSLKDVNGEIKSLKSYKDAKGYIVIFTCNHCPYAKAYEDRIIQLHNDYASQGYPVVAINPNDPMVVPEDSYVAMQMRAKEKGFTFDYLFDKRQQVYPMYGATRTPHVYLLDKSRKVHYIGAIDDNYADADKVKETYLRDAIEAMKMDKKPDPAYTKAIGCTIKVKS